MEELSKNQLIFIAVFALVIVMTGSFLFYTKLGGEKLTGAMVEQAIARLNITSRASINFTISAVDWGSGYVNDTALYCLLNTEGANNALNCTNFSTVYQGLRLENDGNRNVEINISTNTSAAQFLGGTGPEFMWKFANNESDSCASKGIGTNCITNVSALSPQTYTSVATTSIMVCPCYRAANPSDFLNLELQLKVPSDSFTGVRESTITAVATAI